MAKTATSLYKFFQPASYKLAVAENHCQLFIEGRKLSPPSKRITLHQKGLKIESAKITRLDKRGAADYEIARINHMPTFEQVRLHTNEIMYPGPYVIELACSPAPTGKDLKSRDSIPCIDEPEAWASSLIELD